jgi:hypothetical protein
MMVAERLTETKKLPPVPDEQKAPEYQSSAVMHADSYEFLHQTPYVHQLWGTMPDFHGGWACGAVSSVMALAGLGKLPPKRHQCSGQENDFGWYVSNQYAAHGTDFHWTEPDPWGSRHAGAYGYVVGGGLAQWRLVAAYLSLHDTELDVRYGNVTSGWLRAQLEQGALIVISGQVFGYGHLITLCGYAGDKWIVNDPYGNGSATEWGRSANGQYCSYTSAQIDPRAAWAVRA